MTPSHDRRVSNFGATAPWFGAAVGMVRGGYGAGPMRRMCPYEAMQPHHEATKQRRWSPGGSRSSQGRIILPERQRHGLSHNLRSSPILTADRGVQYVLIKFIEPESTTPARGP